MTYRQRVSKIRAYVPCLFLKDSNTSSGLFGLAPSRKLIVYMFFEVIHRKITLWIINTAEDCTRMHILCYYVTQRDPWLCSSLHTLLFPSLLSFFFSGGHCSAGWNERINWPWLLGWLSIELVLGKILGKWRQPPQYWLCHPHIGSGTVWSVPLNAWTGFFTLFILCNIQGTAVD